MTTPDSFLTVEIVPIVTETDRLLYHQAMQALCRLVQETVLEMREYSQEEIDEWMGNL